MIRFLTAGPDIAITVERYTGKKKALVTDQSVFDWKILLLSLRYMVVEV